MTEDEAVAALDALTGDDPEEDHGKADDILKSQIPLAVLAAYVRLEQRARWWATG